MTFDGASDAVREFVADVAGKRYPGPPARPQEHLTPTYFERWKVGVANRVWTDDLPAKRREPREDGA